MKKIKILLSVLLILIITFGGAGCMLQRNSRNHYGMVEYLNDKYDDTFEFYEVYGGTLFGGDSQKKILCTSEKFPNTFIRVIYDTNTKIYYDNYIPIKYVKQLDELTNKILAKAFPQNDYYYDSFEKFVADSGCKNMPADTTFEEYISNCGKVLYACVNYETTQIDLNQIQTDLEEQIVNAGLFLGGIEIYILSDYDKILESDYSIWSNILPNKEYVNHLSAEMNDNTGFTKATWEK